MQLARLEDIAGIYRKCPIQYNAFQELLQYMAGVWLKALLAQTQNKHAIQNPCTS